MVVLPGQMDLHVSCSEARSRRQFYNVNNPHIFDKRESWDGKDHLGKEVLRLSSEESRYIYIFLFCKQNLRLIITVLPLTSIVTLDKLLYFRIPASL